MPKNDFKKITGVTVSVLLAIHAGLLAYGAYVHSPTYNEPGHLVAGISYWQFGRFDVYNVNPPLVRLIAAAPVLVAGCETDWKSFYDEPGARPEMAMGSDFCTANGFRTCWLMTLARWGCIPFNLLGGYFVFRWSKELYGTLAGLLSLTLWCFCPNIIAHGQLITSDAAATSLGLVACYTFWKWLRKPSWWGTIISGVILGVAELAKTTLVIFYPLWPILWIIYRWSDRKEMTRKRWRQELLMLCTRICIGLYVVNLGYGFEGSCTKLGDFEFVSKSLAGEERTESVERKVQSSGGNRFSGTWLACLPVPLPMNYVLGIDLQRKDFESYHNEFYLGGEWSKTGWWYYYLYALAIKVPIGILLLILFASIARFWAGTKIPFRDEFFLLAPGIVILAFVSSQTGMNEHMRYVLPIFPFFYIWIGRIIPSFNFYSLRRNAHSKEAALKIRYLIPALLISASIVWFLVSSLGIYPNSLAYFNEIVGGPAGGPKHLLHSNIDWGQDMLKLKRWIEHHPQREPLKINCFTSVPSKIFGLNSVAFNDQEINSISEKNLKSVYADPSTIPAGSYAISANRLHVYERSDKGYKDNYRGFLMKKPDAIIGFSIFVYHIAN